MADRCIRPNRLLWLLVSSFVLTTHSFSIGSADFRIQDAGNSKAASLSSWNICPPNTDKVLCFEKYLVMLVRARGKRGSRRSLDKAIDAYSDLCTRAGDPKSCLQDLMRTLPRNADVTDDSFAPGEEIFKFDQDLCPEGSTAEQCYEMSKQMSEERNNKGDVKRSDEYEESLDLHQRLKRQMCPESMNRVKCFESFLGGYLRTLVNQERGHSRIPGKRSTKLETMVTRSMPVCPPSMNRVACFDHFVAMFLRVLQHQNEAGELPS